jgi:hypothetical protein
MEREELHVPLLLLLPAVGLVPPALQTVGRGRPAWDASGKGEQPVAVAAVAVAAGGTTWSSVGHCISHNSSGAGGLRRAKAGLNR